jgi:ribonuclease P protein component
MIGRLSGRQSFLRLQAEGRKDGRGPIRLVSRTDNTTIPRVAFAVPRSVGNAVVRNRTKRRIRAVIHELDTRSGVPGGDYLVRVTGPIEHWSHHQLQSTMAHLLITPTDKPASLPVGAST